MSFFRIEFCTFDRVLNPIEILMDCHLWERLWMYSFLLKWSLSFGNVAREKKFGPVLSGKLDHLVNFLYLMGLHVLK